MKAGNVLSLEKFVTLLLLLLSGMPVAAEDKILVAIKIHVNGAVVNPLYDDDDNPAPGESLDVDGMCTDHDDEVSSQNTVNIVTCEGDVLTLRILFPELYRTSPFGLVSIDRIEIEEINEGNSSEIEFEATATDDVDVNVYLIELVPSFREDPVAPRWIPDAGSRSSGTLPWGPAHLAATPRAIDTISEAFPSLLYSSESFHKQVDLAVKGRGLDFVFSRVHRSGAPTGNLDDDDGETVDNAGFAGQWTHSFDITAQAYAAESNSPVFLTLGNGTRVPFLYEYKDDSSTPKKRYYYAEGWDAELQLVITGSSPNFASHFLLRFGDGVDWLFPTWNYGVSPTDVQRLEEIQDRFGNTMSFEYDGSDRLETITDTMGRGYTLAYNGAGAIESLTEEDGLERVVSYGYDGNGRLETVTYPPADGSSAAPVITYGYDSAGRLETVTDPRGNVALSNSYNVDGALEEQAFGAGAETGTVTYVYTGLTLESGEDHGVRVTDAAGHVSEHFFNARNQRVRLRQLDEDRVYVTRTAWEQHAHSDGGQVSDDLPTSVTLPDGAVVDYEYTGPGTTDADYKYRMNVTKVTRTGADGATVVEEFGRSRFDCGTSGENDFWDARFGEQFYTCHAIKDGEGTVLRATAYTYSTDGKATLDGVDFHGIAAYGADNPFCLCAEILPAEVTGMPGGEEMMILGAGEDAPLELYSLAAAGEMYGLGGEEFSPMFGFFESLGASSAMYGGEGEGEVPFSPLLGEGEGGLESMAFSGEGEPEGEAPFGFSAMSEGEGEGEALALMPGTAHHVELTYWPDGQIQQRKHPDNDTDDEPADKVRRVDRFDYTTAGYLEKITVDYGTGPSFENLVTEYAPDAVGRVERVTDPRGAETDVEFDDLDRVVKVERPEIDTGTDYRPTTEWLHDANGNVTHVGHAWTDRDGGPITLDTDSIADGLLTTEYVYDSRNRVEAIRREDGAGLTITEMDYDGNGNVIERRSPLAVSGEEPDNVATYVYDARDLLVLTTRGGTQTTRLFRDEAGRVERVIEAYGLPEARETVYHHDGLGHLTSMVDAAGLTTSYGPDALGRARLVEAREGTTLLARTRYEYELPGRLTEVVMRHRDADGNPVGDGDLTTLLAYTDAGLVYREDAEGDVTTREYDSAMRLAKIVSPQANLLPGPDDGNERAFAYDANGNLIVETERAYDTATEAMTEFITRRGYDPLNRLISLGHDDGDNNSNDANTTAYAYDSLGQLEQETDARGYATVHTYDPLGRRNQSTHGAVGIDPINAVVAYAWDANDRLETFTDPNGRVTAYFYDALDRSVRTEYADGRAERFLYDGLDNVIEHYARSGLLTSTLHDAMGRPIEQTFSRLAGRTDPGTTAFSYDGLGRVLEARNSATTLSYRYDSLGNVVSEGLEAGGVSLAPVTRTFNAKGQLRYVDPPGGPNVLEHGYSADGLLTQVRRGGGVVAEFDYLGARPDARRYGAAGAAGSSSVAYEPTGLRPEEIVHAGAGSTVVDERGYTWDGAYNLDSFSVTEGALAGPTVNLDYDALNRLDPDAGGFTAGWSLDDAGNREGGGFDFEGEDELMHRYSEAGGLDQFHDAAGALVKAEVDANEVREFQYDAQGRLVHYRQVTLAGTLGFDPLVLDGDWDQGISDDDAWAVDDAGTPGVPGDDFLKETTGNPGVILYQKPPELVAGFTFEYRSPHGSADPDDDGVAGETNGDDYAPRYHAQVLVDVAGTGPDFPYVALRIEPDRLSVVHYEAGALHEVDAATVETVADEWYTVTVRMVFGGGELAGVYVERTGEAAGGAVSLLVRGIPVGELPDIGGDRIGFTVGAAAEYGFRLKNYALDLDASTVFVDWAYDAFGRKAMETVYTGAKSLEIDSQTLYTYDGWRLLAETGVERDDVTNAVESVRNRAEYVYGPGYIDDVVASYRDTNTDGDYGDASELRYHLTDQQYSTVALLDAAGGVVERYGYDAFGAPAIYNAAGTAITSSAVSNAVLYTGRPWQPELAAYDLRNRHYAPANGRFLTTDAVFDPANLGNPYTYVGNNPFAYVDPMGEERWGTQSYGAEVLDLGAGMIFGMVDAAVGTVEAALSPIETAKGIAAFAGQVVADPAGTIGGAASSFYAQFEDSDTAGQAAGAVVSSLAPGGVAGKAATAGRAARAAGRAAEAAGDAAKAARVAGNINASRVAREASRFDVHLATEEIYANANKAVATAREAGLSNRKGALGMEAHREFARRNAATSEKFAERGIEIKIEPYADVAGERTRRAAPGSLSVDALLQQHGQNIRGFDLKTGRPWPNAGAADRSARFGVPIQQIQP